MKVLFKFMNGFKMWRNADKDAKHVNLELGLGGGKTVLFKRVTDKKGTVYFQEVGA